MYQKLVTAELKLKMQWKKTPEAFSRGKRGDANFQVSLGAMNCGGTGSCEDRWHAKQTSQS